MSVRLIETGADPDLRREILISKDEFLVGRGTDCDLRLNDSEVSRHHCMFRLQNQDVFIMDLGSSNGTFVNSLRVRSQKQVNVRDEVQIGPFHFLLDIDDESGINWGDLDNVQATEVTQKLHSMQREIEKARNQIGTESQDDNSAK